jgi:hypothetical protein
MARGEPDGMWIGRCSADVAKRIQVKKEQNLGKPT